MPKLVALLSLLIPVTFFPSACSMGSKGGVGSPAGQSGSSAGGQSGGGVQGGGQSGGGAAGGQGGIGQGLGGTTGAHGGNPGGGGQGGGSPGAGGTSGGQGGGGSPGPASEADYSMDVGWQFNKSDVTGAQATTFADTGAGWSQISTPHTFNDIDSYRVLISQSGGDHGMFSGPTWYRKHFKVPAKFSGNKLIVEFERIRASATFYINGTQVGTYSDAISPYGLDITGKVTVDGVTDNVLAVRVDNSAGANYWDSNATYPDYGGLTGHVWLHVPGKVYQTYPLYQNLQTSGIYVYGTGYTNIVNNTAQGDTGDLTLNVESEVKNESGSAATATLGVKVVDPTTGTTLGSFSGAGR